MTPAWNHHYALYSGAGAGADTFGSRHSSACGKCVWYQRPNRAIATRAVMATQTGAPRREHSHPCRMACWMCGASTWPASRSIAAPIRSLMDARYLVTIQPIDRARTMQTGAAQRSDCRALRQPMSARDCILPARQTTRVLDVLAPDKRRLATCSCGSGVSGGAGIYKPCVYVGAGNTAAHLCMYDDPAPPPPAAVGNVLCLLGGSVLEPAAGGGLPLSSSRCHLQHDGHCRFELSQFVAFV